MNFRKKIIAIVLASVTILNNQVGTYAIGKEDQMVNTEEENSEKSQKRDREEAFSKEKNEETTEAKKKKVEDVLGRMYTCYGYLSDDVIRIDTDIYSLHALASLQLNAERDKGSMLKHLISFICYSEQQLRDEGIDVNSLKSYSSVEDALRGEGIDVNSLEFYNSINDELR